MALAAIRADMIASGLSRELCEQLIRPQRERIEAVMKVEHGANKPGDAAGNPSVGLPADPLTPQNANSQQAVWEAYSKLQQIWPTGSLSSREGLQTAVRAAFAAANNVALSALLGVNQDDYVDLVASSGDLTDEAFRRRLEALQDLDLEYRKNVWENVQAIWRALRRGERGEFVPGPDTTVGGTFQERTENGP